MGNTTSVIHPLDGHLLLPFPSHSQYLLSSAVLYSCEKLQPKLCPLLFLRRLTHYNTGVISELQTTLQQHFFSQYELSSSEHTQCSCQVMSYQFTCKAILLICLCSVGLSGLKLHCKAIKGSYSRDPVSQCDKRAKRRLWHRLSCSGCLWHSTGLGPGRAANHPTSQRSLCCFPF